MKNHSPYFVRKIRNLFIALLTIHLLLLLEKLLFNIFGYVYLLIILDAITSCFLVLTIWASCSFLPTPLYVLVVWSIPWLAFNCFVIIVYSGLFHVPEEYLWLDLKVHRLKWLHENILGCTFNATTTTTTSTTSTSLIKHTTLTDCFITYEHVEIIHSSLQIIVSVVDVVLSCWLSGRFKIEEEEDYFSFFGGFDSLSARVPPTESSLPRIKCINDDLH